MLTLFFMVQQDIPVRDLKPAIVKVYDYYEKGEQEHPEHGHSVPRAGTQT
jgi:hypothetical protein